MIDMDLMEINIGAVFKQYVPPLLDFLSSAVIMIVLAALAIAIYLFWSFIKQFKHTAEVRQILANGKYFVSIDKFRIASDKDGGKFLQLLNRKERLPAPPPEAMDITKKGNFFVVLYHTTEGTYAYGQDDTDYKDVIGINKGYPKDLSTPSSWSEKIKSMFRKEERYIYFKHRTPVIEGYRSLPTNQRIMLINQLKKAYDRKKMNWKEHIVTIASIASITLLVICLMVFWGDLAKPTLEMSSRLDTNLAKQMEIQKMQQESIDKLQHIDGTDQIPSQNYGTKEKPPN
jgi:hypothetical protein